MNTPGLEYTSQQDTNDSAAAAAAADTAYTQVNTPKSKYLPTGISAGALSPEQTNELLANMQRMIEQRTGFWNTISGGIKDALAYTPPAENGQQAAALQYRNEQKRKEAEELMGMQTAMASIAGQQQLAQNMRAQMNQVLQGGRSGSFGTDGLQPDIFGGSEIPPEVRQSIALEKDPFKAKEIYQKYLNTAATERTKARLNPSWYEETEVVGLDGQLIKIPRIQAVELAMQNPNNPRNRAVIKTSAELSTVNPSNRGDTGAPSGLSTAAAGAPRLHPQGNAAEIAEGLGVPIVSGYRSPEKQAELYAASQKPGYAGPPVAKPGASQHQHGNAIDVDSRRMTPEARQKLIDNGFVQPLPKTDPNHWELAGAREKPIAPTQVAGPAQVATGTPPRALPNESASTYKDRLKQWEAEQATRREGLGSQVKETNEFLKGLKSGAEAAKTKKGMVEHIERTAADNPDDFYVAGQTSGGKGVMGAIVNARKFMGGDEKAKDAEQSLEPYFMSKEAVDRRRKIDAYAGQLAMGSSKELLGDSSVRLGAQIEKMFLDYKGLGTTLPAETNKAAAKMYNIMLERTIRQDAAAREFVARHPTATPTEIINSPAYRAVDDWASRQLESTFGEKAKVSEQEMALEELKRRRQQKGGAQ